MTRSRVRDERGTMTLWVLGLCVAVMFLGGLSVDLWRVIAVRRSLVAMADAGATAGANGIDQDGLRRGVLVLDPALARADAGEALRAQTGWPAVDAATVDVGANRVTVTVRAKVNFTLLGIFVSGHPMEVQASALSRAYDQGRGKGRRGAGRLSARAGPGHALRFGGTAASRMERSGPGSPRGRPVRAVSPSGPRRDGVVAGSHGRPFFSEAAHGASRRAPSSGVA